MEECPGNRPEQKPWLDQVMGSQAVDQDYSGTRYTKAHLNTNGHHNGSAQSATFTLTNAVPQIQALNTLWAKQYEEQMQHFIDSVRSGPCPSAYVLTGAIPSNNQMNKRVTIPSSIWSAFCCVNNNNNQVPTGSMAFWLENNPNVTNIEIMTLQDLQDKLGKKLNSQVTLFQNNCKMLA
ncbi:ENDD1 protein, partial [Polyodon spathula]|nr:ENDD1 protein [Polyodon spathula]